jgi:transitional endoplasmic reticulum ATPase
MGDNNFAPSRRSVSGGFDAFNNHGSSTRVNSEVALQAALRDLHRPDKVTWVKAEDCDILGFAEAGHAKAHLRDGPDSNDAYIAIRKYQIPARSLEEPEGSVTDTVWYARWDYKWNDQTVPCYKFRWVDDAWKLREFYAFVTEGFYNMGPSTIANNNCFHTESLIKACGAWTQELHDEVYVYEDGDWQKNKTLSKAVSKSSWDDVIIDPAMKKDIIRDVESFFSSRSTYTQYNIPWKRGIILHGPPGCGKTISIKALMNSVRQRKVANLYVKSFKASGCQSDQASIRQIFIKARAVAPALLIFEDLDSLVTDELRSFFLNEVDGVEDNSGILIIGSTNHIDRLDTSITRRPSRFDRKFHFKAPSEAERKLYAAYWQQKLQSNEDINFTNEICQAVAESTEGFTFAYLKELFVQTLLMHITGSSEDADEVSSEEQATSETTAAEGPSTDVNASLEGNRFYQALRRRIKALAEDLEAVDGKDAEGEKKNGKADEKPELERTEAAEE